jgi:hypothetical protein
MGPQSRVLWVNDRVGIACRVEKVCELKHRKQSGSSGTYELMDGEADI